MDEWRLGRAIEESMSAAGHTPVEIQNAIQAIRIGMHQHDWYVQAGSQNEKQLLKKWLSDLEIQNFLKVNRYNDILWYNRESFSELLTWMQVIALVENQKEMVTRSTLAETLIGTGQMMGKIKLMDKKSAYQVLKLIS